MSLPQLRKMEANNLVIMPPNSDALMMRVLQREEERLTAYGHCGKGGCQGYSGVSGSLART